MTADELARLLRRAAEKGELKKEKMEHLILFGIKYADELDRKNIRDVVGRSGLYENPQTGVTEVRRGIKIAKYVSLNDKDVV